MGIIRLSDLEPWIGVQKPAEQPAANALDAAWAKAAATAATVDNAAAAFGGLDQAANDLTDGEAHPSEWTRRFDDVVGKLPVDGLPDEDFADFQQLARSRMTRLKVDAVRRQHEDVVARFEDALDGYVQKAADAPSNAIEATFRNQALRAIERIDGAGLLGPGMADKFRAELPARIDRALAMRAIERDPAHAAALLTQPGALPALGEPEREHLARKAGIRAERQGHEKALADERHRAGTVAGLWSRVDTLDDTDIDAAEADGRLLAGEAQDFRQRLQVDRDARQRRTDAIARVNDILAGEGALDPSSPEDRKAVDAHFAETERGWDDRQVPADQHPGLIGAYVGRTGILPPALRKRIGAAFRGGDATRRNEAADVIEAIVGSAGRGGLIELPVEDLLPSILILSLRDNGLDPDAAAARATAIIGGDAPVRDRNFRRDLTAAGKWAEESGSFDDDQLGELREGLDGLQATGAGAHSAGERAATGPVVANANQPPVDPDAALTELQQILTDNFGIKDPSTIDPNGPRTQVAFVDDLPYLAPLIALLAGALGIGAREAERQRQQRSGSSRSQSEESADQAAKPQISPYMTPAPPPETKYPNIPPPGLDANEPMIFEVQKIPWDRIPPGIRGFGPEDKPFIEVFPDQSGEIPQITIIEHKGIEHTRQQNTSLARLCEELGKEIGRPIEHTGGARTDQGAELKETWAAPRNQDPAHPLKGGSFFDVTCTDQETKRRMHIETVTTKADGVTPDSRENKQALIKLINKESGDLLVLVPKAPPGKTLDLSNIGDFLRPLVKELGRPHQAGSPTTEGWHQFPPTP